MTTCITHAACCVTAGWRRILATMLLAGAAAAGAQTIEISTRLQPGRDVLLESNSELRMQVRIIEDRGGLLAKLGGRLPPASGVDLLSRERIRMTTGAADAAGDFDASIRFVASYARLRDPQGREQALPQRNPMTGTEVRLKSGPDGRLRPESIQIAGVDQAMLERLRPALAAMLQQVSSLDRITVSMGEPTSTRMRMKLPAPGLADMDIDMVLTYTLQSLEGDIAKLALNYTMEMATAAHPMKLKATGGGIGAMDYDVRRALVPSSVTDMSFSLEIDMPEGTVGLTLVNRLTQAMRDAGQP
jgi:hypothetical protein